MIATRNVGGNVAYFHVLLMNESLELPGERMSVTGCGKPGSHSVEDKNKKITYEGDPLLLI